MTYSLCGLARDPFAPLFAMDDDALAATGARRLRADADNAFPCRIRLADVAAGESVILLNYVSHDVPGPFRTAYAIYVSEEAANPGRYVDALPESLESRPLSLRAFDEEGMIVTATLALAGTGDAAVRLLFADARIAYILAHFAAYGCFAARIDRHGEQA